VPVLVGSLGVVGGEVETYGFHVNFIKEFNSQGRLSPYIGVGIGYAEADVDLFYNAIEINDNEGSFSYQLIAGLDLQLTNCVSFFAEYNYRSITDDITLQRQVGGVASTLFESDDFSFHSIQGGLRVAF